MKYHYTVQILYINRYDCPSDRSLDGRIEKIWVETIDKFSSYYDFRIGDIINIKDNYYVVTERIFNGEADASTDYVYVANTVILRVVRYRDTHVHQHGSDTWRETIPLFPEEE